jgi:hypothetical protein
MPVTPAALPAAWVSVRVGWRTARHAPVLPAQNLEAGRPPCVCPSSRAQLTAPCSMGRGTLKASRDAVRRTTLVSLLTLSASHRGHHVELAMAYGPAFFVWPVVWRLAPQAFCFKKRARTSNDPETSPSRSPSSGCMRFGVRRHGMHGRQAPSKQSAPPNINATKQHANSHVNNTESVASRAVLTRAPRFDVGAPQART